MRINVEGTKNVLDFLAGRAAPRSPRLRLDRLRLRDRGRDATARRTSTSGSVQELLRGDEVPRRGGGEGERAARARSTGPASSSGTRSTGETAKFDGPYFALNAMSLLPSPGASCSIGDGTAEVNLVPVDFVLEAIARLGAWDGAVGKTYHLTDPRRTRPSSSPSSSRRRSASRSSSCPSRSRWRSSLFVAAAGHDWFGMPRRRSTTSTTRSTTTPPQADRGPRALRPRCPPFADVRPAPRGLLEEEASRRSLAER